MNFILIPKSFESFELIRLGPVALQLGNRTDNCKVVVTNCVIAELHEVVQLYDSEIRKVTTLRSSSGGSPDSGVQPVQDS